ncbi:MAG: hypothetical protein CMI34_00150 [Opitutales bacterium]|nr:hypothetical protein [Opitutales bacterium]|tara:strand:- start:274 stop:462 length:189 start_codon:yes stop_codon:yes gene_type:complete
MINFQIDNIQGTLEWIKTCPADYTISSMQGGFIHIKILVPSDRQINFTENKKTLSFSKENKE